MAKVYDNTVPIFKMFTIVFPYLNGVMFLLLIRSKLVPVIACYHRLYLSHLRPAESL